MIYVTGDTHGEFKRLGSKDFSGGPGDYLIVCGDFGGIWDDSHQEQYWRIFCVMTAAFSPEISFAVINRKILYIVENMRNQ